MRYIFSPEFLWLLFYGIANLIGKANVPPTKAIDNFIDKCWFWVPLVCVALTFALWWFPMVEKKWLMPRTWLLGMIGGHFVLEKILSAYSNQGPGIGTGYLVGMFMFLIFLAIGSVVVWIKF